MPLGSEDRREARQLARKADHIAMLIVASDYPLIDIQIARSNLRNEAEELCPERLVGQYTHDHEGSSGMFMGNFRR